MPSVRYFIKSSKNPASLYVRFTHTSAIDQSCPTGLFVNPKAWENKKQRVKSLVKDSKLNNSINDLREYIYSAFNDSMIESESIGKYWLYNIVSKYYNRSTNKTANDFKSVLEYSKDWVEHKSDSWVSSDKGTMNKRTKQHLTAFVKLLDQFENSKKVAMQFNTLNKEDIYKFINWLSENDYQPSTIKRHVGRFKFFCLRAQEENIQVNSAFKSRYYIKEVEDVKLPYLNEEEINLIYKYDFSYSKRLDNARDSFIIGLWTGLRVSDFLYNLDTENIDDEFIDIKTQKTNTWVSIPIHKMIREILNKRNGKLPKKISDVNFNKYIKEICFIVGIDNEIKGRLVMESDKSTYNKKRKILGMYPKYKLVSSHICRRSFATNLYGKIPNQAIMSICGWSTEKMMLNYIKKSSRDQAKILKQHWEKVI